jgi:hypothetical protein
MMRWHGNDGERWKIAASEVIPLTGGGQDVVDGALGGMN